MSLVKGPFAIAVFAVLLAAADEPVGIPDTMRTPVAIAQRNYFAAKIQYDEAARVLQDSIGKAETFCKEKGRKFDPSVIQCSDR